MATRTGLKVPFLVCFNIFYIIFIFLKYIDISMYFMIFVIISFYMILPNFKKIERFLELFILTFWLALTARRIQNEYK